jgi:predicted nucleotidyltransferase
MEDKKLDNIVKIIADEIHPKKLLLFGSRSKGKFQYNSDYDIAIDSNLLNLKEKRELREKLESVTGLHKIDLVFLTEIDIGFKNIIEKTGIVIYEC